MAMNFNLKTRIKVNGKEYNSIEELPPDVRSAYEKAIANLQSSASTHPVNTRAQITFNGQTFNNPDEMPEDLRKIYESAMSAVDKNELGLPGSNKAKEELAFEPAAPIIPAPVEKSPSKTNSIVVIAALIVLLFMLLGVALFVLSSR